MNELVQDIRPNDVALAAVMSVIGLLLMIGNMRGPVEVTRIDSTSWTTIPRFVLACGAVRLLADRRRSAVALVLTIDVQILVVVRDSAAGSGVPPVTVGIGIALWGAGWFVRSPLTRRGLCTAEPRSMSRPVRLAALI